MATLRVSTSAGGHWEEALPDSARSLREGANEAPWHPNTGLIESLDYEAFDSASPCSSESGSGAAGWVMCVFIGGAMALAALLINLTVENLTGAKFLTASTLLEDQGIAASFIFFAFVNVALAFSASAVTALYAPAAAGSGIGDVKAYLNGVDVPGMCLARTLAAKVAGSAGVVAGGLAVGKEGPFVHIGAALAVLLGQGGTAQRHLRWRWLASLRNDRARRDFVTIGASVGVTAAFRAPVGGLLFSLEELATHWRPQLTWRCFAANAVCVVTMRACMRWCAGSGEGGRCGAFDSTGALYLFDISPETGGQVRVMAMELLPMACLAVLGGLLGAAFNAASEILCTWRRDVLARRSPLAQVSEAVLLAAITSAVCFFVPLAFACSPCPRHLGDCPRSATHPTGNFVGFGCAAPGQYNDLATLLFNTPEGAIRNLFSSQTSGEFTTGSLVAFFTLFFTLSLLTYGTTIPSGLFVPSALCGATYGRLVGASLVARLGEASSEGIQEGTYALLGAAAFLAGATRMTVSLCVILLELTANLSLLPSMMAVLLIAKATGDLLNSSAYDTHIALKRLPLLHASPERSQRRLTAAQLVAHQGGHPEALCRHVRARDALSLLASCTHNGFPVLDPATGALQGLVLRRTLLALLRAQSGELGGVTPLRASPGGDGDSDSSFAASAAAAAATAASAGVDAVRWASSPEPSAQLRELEARLTEAQREAVLDLGPWLNAAPHSVLPDAPLRHIHALFREMGLRHLIVLRQPPGAGVLGVLTRKDLLPGVIRLRTAAAERRGVQLAAL